MYLRWEAPFPPRGELEKYKVEYKLQSAHSHDFKEAVHNNFEKCDYWKGKICFKLNSSDGIIENKDYSIKITAKNKETNLYGKEVNIIVRTQEKAPEPPENLRVIKRTPHAIELAWQYPSITNGFLRKFLIGVKLLSSQLRRQNRSRELPETEFIVKPYINYSYKVKDLQPSSEYEVSVRGVTVKPGEPAVIKSVKTLLVLPDIGSQLKLVEDYTASTTPQVIIPPADPFLTKESSYFVVVTSDKEEVAASVRKIEMMEFILKTADVKNGGHSWIAAEIKPQDQEMIFKVGDNTTTISGTSGNVYWNRPLEPGLLYDLTLVALNWQDGEYESSFTKLKHPDQALSEKEGGIGAEWTTLLLLLIIPVAVYFVIRKPKQTEPIELIYEDADAERQEQEADRSPDVRGADDPVYEIVV